MLSESAARWLLVLHAGLGVTAVGAATHLVLWLRRYVRGAGGRRRAVVRFAWLVLALQLATFACGNLMYPTYKVEVRVAYLENASAIVADTSARGKELARLAEREHAAPSQPTATAELVRRATAAARWFDVKEHWVALGMFVAAALLLVLSLWNPERDGRTIAPIVVGLAALTAGTTWLAAIIGVLTAAWRAV
ncbi:MAG: hypothetical protein ACM31C_21995 [Acidobacteriota bacterium]